MRFARIQREEGHEFQVGVGYLTSPSLNYASQPTELQETLIDLPLPSAASSVQNGDEFLPPAWVQ